MYLSMLPPWAKITSLIAVKYSLSWATISAGRRVSERVVKPRMSLISTVTW